MVDTLIHFEHLPLVGVDMLGQQRMRYQLGNLTLGIDKLFVAGVMFEHRREELGGGF